MQVGNEALVLSAVGVIGLGCQWLAWRLRLPAILFLLLAGLIVGPLFRGQQPVLRRTISSVLLGSSPCCSAA